MYCNVVTAIDKIPTYLLRFNSERIEVYKYATISSARADDAGHEAEAVQCTPST